MNTNLILILLVGALVGATSGYLGSYMVLKRMSLVGDALSHVALPGIAIAMAMGVNPLLGALIALVIATIGIWYLGEHSEVYPEALVGIFFTASLSIGLLITPEPDLLEALFGNIDKIGAMDGVITIFGAIVIFIITFAFSKKLLLGIVSEDLAKSQGVDVSKVNLVYLLLIALVVALGVKFLGTLLTGAMVIIPAVTAKNLAKSIKQFQLYAIFFGVTSSILGILLAKYIGISSGPAVVLTSISIFLIGYAFKN
ncbi:MAG: metal ABC transporter permease [Candidatus Woesebacteria bacterium]|nr:MAG: metal ABC transporter permease [Candidatus Woesebacteria bacterium]